MSKLKKYAFVFAAMWFIPQAVWQSARVDIPVDEHFDGRHFRNPPGEEVKKSLWEVLGWRWRRETPEWPTTDEAPTASARPELDEGQLRVTGVGHATVLIESRNYALLTDPIWSETVGALPFLSVRRSRPPAVRFEDLPRIDAVLISHNHYDHLDLPTLQRLEERDHPAFFVPLGDAGWLRDEGLTQVTALDWWQTVELDVGVKLTATPARHWSGRTVLDEKLSLWCGYWIELAGERLFFAGDTGLGKHFGEIRERFGPPDVALLPIGAYAPRVFMAPQHMSPHDAVVAHRALRAKRSLGIHYDTFPLADEAFGVAPKDLGAEGLPPSEFAPIGFGVGWVFCARGS